MKNLPENNKSWSAKKIKPKYNMFQNSCYMIKIAWQAKEKKVIVLCLLSAVLALITNLINLYIPPVILGAVEKKVGAGELIFIVAAFTLGIMLFFAATAYADTNIVYGKVTLRSEMLAMINRKAATTSYSNVVNDRFRKDFDRACLSVASKRSSTEEIWDTLGSLLTDIAGFVIYLKLLSNVQPMLFVVVLVTGVISYFAANYANSFEYKHKDETAEYKNHIDYILKTEDELGAAKDIRIFGLRGWLEELYAKVMKAYMVFNGKVQNVHMMVALLDVILTFMRNGIAYMYLIMMVLNGEIDVARFLLLFTAVGGFAQWVTGILKEFNNLHRQSIDISMTREFLEYDEPFKFAEGEPLSAERDKEYEIRLENVSFRYPGADKDTLAGINLTLHSGEKLAVVGLNGAGKTTLVKLICGFLNPTRGSVFLNGKDIRDFNRADYYTMFSAVFQDFLLLPGTIAMNIAQTDENIDLPRVRKCAAEAGIGEKIETLADGYNTYLDRQVYKDAVMLSGGETQSLMLARALYKDAPFVVLDEPTAALDPIAESKLYQKYSELTKGKGSVYISHRLVSTMFCDRIIMLGNGGIIEKGTHVQLLNNNGEYAKLYGIQSKYYKEGENDDEE